MFPGGRLIISHIIDDQHVPIEWDYTVMYYKKIKIKNTWKHFHRLYRTCANNNTYINNDTHNKNS